MSEPSDKKAFTKKLRSRLYRFDCPDSYDLGEYGLGLLSDEKKKAIKEHLESCPLCRKELRVLKRFLEDDADKQKIESRELAKQTRVIPFPRNEVRYGHPEQQYAIRGAAATETNRMISISYGDGRFIDLYYGIQGEGAAYRVSGQFIVPESLEKTIEGASLEIWNEQTIIASLEIDEFCSFAHTTDRLGIVLIRVSNREGTLLSFYLDLEK